MPLFIKVTLSKGSLEGKKPNHLPFYRSGLEFDFQKHLESGGRYRARTSDPLLVRQVLSQLS